MYTVGTKHWGVLLILSHIYFDFNFLFTVYYSFSQAVNFAAVNKHHQSAIKNKLFYLNSHTFSQGNLVEGVSCFSQVRIFVIAF